MAGTLTRRGARSTAQDVSVRPRIRVVRRGEIAMGPGKADLLEAIRDTGSIAEAARKLDMSYMRAWQLVRTMNVAFRKPLVAKRRGGTARGGAALTADGRRVLETYRAMEAAAARVIASKAGAIRRRLR